MSKLRYFVVVSVSATILLRHASAIAGVNPPEFDLSNAETAASQTVNPLNPLQHHSPNGDSFSKVKSEENEKVTAEQHDIKGAGEHHSTPASANPLKDAKSPSILAHNHPEPTTRNGDKTPAATADKTDSAELRIYPPAPPHPLNAAKSPSILAHNHPEPTTRNGDKTPTATADKTDSAELRIYPPAPPHPLSAAKSPSILAHNHPEPTTRNGDKTPAATADKTDSAELRIYPPAPPHPLSAAKSPSILAHNHPEPTTRNGDKTPTAASTNEAAANFDLELQPIPSQGNRAPATSTNNTPKTPSAIPRNQVSASSSDLEAQPTASRQSYSLADTTVSNLNTSSASSTTQSRGTNSQLQAQRLPQPPQDLNPDKVPPPPPTQDFRPDRVPPPPPTQVSPIAPIPTGANVPIPNYLNANPNPLQFPTRPEEVDIEVTQPLTLAQALELVRGNSRTLQVAQLQLERSRAQLREAEAALYPTLSLQAEFSGGQSTNNDLQIRRAREDQRNLPEEARQDIPDQEATASLSGSISFNYDIFTGGERIARIRAAREQVRSSQLEVERLFEQNRLEVSIAYYDLQQADEQIRISESAVRNAQRSLQDALALFEAGLGTRFDVLRAQVQLARENQTLIRARADQRTRRRDLARLLSLPQYVNVVAADPVEIAGLWNLTLEQSIVLAFQNRAELQQQLAQRNISRQLRRAELAAIQPRVSFFFDYSIVDVFNDGLGLADGYSAGARLTWNFFDGGRARSRAAQQQANIAIAETQFADNRNSIRFEVEQAYFDLLANLENIQTASVALEQAREALRLARLRFQAGVGTQTEVIDAENDLTQAEGDRVRAILDYNRALSRLQRAISNLPATTATVAP